MMFVRLKIFSQKTGLPVTYLRRMCKNGTFPSIVDGKIIYIDEKKSMDKINDLANIKVEKRKMSFSERLAEL